MTTAIKRRRGTTTQHATFAGLEGELTVDTTKDTVVVHDGATAGGFPLAKESQATTNVAITGGSISGITDLAIADGGTGASTAGNARTNLGVTATGADTTYAFRANNLSDLASASTARTNLGLGTIATQAASSVAVTGGSINGTTVGASTASTGRFSTLEATGVSTFSAGTAALPSITTTGDTNTGIFFPAADTIAFTEGGVESMRIDSSGNVGIGKAPASGIQLDIRNPIGSTTLQIDAFGGTGAQLSLNSPTSNSILTPNFLAFITNSGERMRIDSAGNVGIGISNPGGRLDIAGVGRLRIDTSNDYVYQTIVNAAGSVYKRNIVDALQHEFYGSGSERMRIDSSGNVGIGTSSPTQALDVNGQVLARTVITSKNNASNISYFRFEENSNASAYTYITGDGRSTGNVSIYTNDTERMRIDSSGGLILVGSTAQKATGTTWSNPSDARLKDNIRDYTKGIDELMQVRVREWEYNGKGGTTEGTKGLGVIADEVMTVLPDTVENYQAKLNADDAEAVDIKKFDATEITWLLVKTVQEQQALIENLTTRLNALEGK